MLSTIRIIDSSEMRKVTEFMTAFEKASSFITVDVDYASKTYEKLIRQGIAIVFVLEKGDELIGGLGCVKTAELHSGKSLLVETFWFVSPEHRGHGSLLITEFEKYAKTHNIDKVAMIHLMDSYPDKLEKLYLSRGYVLAEQHYIKEIL